MHVLYSKLDFILFLLVFYPHWSSHGVAEVCQLAQFGLASESCLALEQKKETLIWSLFSLKAKLSQGAILKVFFFLKKNNERGVG